MLPSKLPPLPLESPGLNAHRRSAYRLSFARHLALAPCTSKVLTGDACAGAKVPAAYEGLVCRSGIPPVPVLVMLLASIAIPSSDITTRDA